MVGGLFFSFYYPNPIHSCLFKKQLPSESSIRENQLRCPRLNNAPKDWQFCFHYRSATWCQGNTFSGSVRKVGRCVNPRATLWTTIFNRTQHSLANTGRCAGCWDHGGHTCSSPRLPSPTWSCHCLPCAPRGDLCTHLHIPSALFHRRFIPLATDSLSSKQSSPPRVSAKTKSLTDISSDLKVSYKPCKKDVSINAAVVSIGLQTFKQEHYNPKQENWFCMLF